jgi:hypothetical protein
MESSATSAAIGLLKAIDRQSVHGVLLRWHRHHLALIFSGGLKSGQKPPPTRIALSDCALNWIFGGYSGHEHQDHPSKEDVPQVRTFLHLGTGAAATVVRMFAAAMAPVAMFVRALLERQYFVRRWRGQAGLIRLCEGYGRRREDPEKAPKYQHAIQDSNVHACLQVTLIDKIARKSWS